MNSVSVTHDLLRQMRGMSHDRLLSLLSQMSASPPGTLWQTTEPPEPTLDLGEAFAPPPTKVAAPTAAVLVARWVDGNTEVNGEAPHSALMQRVAGQCKRLAAHCASEADWERARKAAYDAGRAGAVDPTPFLTGRVSRFEKPKSREQEMYDQGWM